MNLNRNLKKSKNIQKYIFTFFIFFYFFSFAQDRKVLESIVKDKNILNSSKIKKIEHLLINSKITKSDSLYYLHQDFAYWLYDINKIEKAIFNETIALNIVLNNLENNLLIQKSQLYLGYYYLKNNNFSKSINVLNAVLEVDKNGLYAIKAHNQLGQVFNKTNNYTKALEHIKLAILMLDNQNLKSIRDYSKNIANISLKLKSYKYYLEGIKYGKKADSIAEIFPTSLNKKYIIKLILASLYNQYETMDTVISLKYYKEALKIAKAKNDSLKTSKAYRLMGNLFILSNQNKALSYLDKSILFSKKSDHYNLHKIYSNFGFAFALKKEYTKSIKFKHKSIKYLINDDLKNINDLNYTIINNSQHKILLISLLNTLAESYLKFYEQSNNEILLNKSISYFKLADYVIDLLKINSKEFKSRLFWRKMSTNIYSKALKACYLSKNTKDAFYFIEKNKALLLMEDIARQNYRLTLDVPKELLDRETNYKKQLSTINQAPNINNKDSLLKLKINIQRRLYTFQDSIYKGKKNHSKEPKILAVTDIQNNLNENEIFIEYHISKDNGFGIYTNNDNGYAIFISKQKTFFQELDDMINFKKELRLYFELLKNPFENKKDKEDFNEKSYAVFNKLFPTKTIKELIQNKKIIISSNDILTFLPFESLVTQKKSNNYLIYSSEISYTYSMSFQEENKKRNRLPQKEFLGIAPIQFVDSLVQLPNTKKEIANLKNIFTGKLLTNENATKHNFNLVSNDYNIIHFATHADATNEEAPWIAFKNKKLTLPELYTTKTQADLIVLSACNTSLGKIETGEGVMSLVRGFFYSGANSVVSTLWKVNDKTSTTIMLYFYKNLKKGETKSKALHNAKLSYLKNHSSTEASPYYWSSFILIGDAGELATVDNNFNYYVLIFSLPFLNVSFWFVRRKFYQKP